MKLLFMVVPLIPVAISLAFSVFAAWGFRRYPRPPVWVICFLVILGFGTFRLLFLASPGFAIALLSSLCAILCIVHALALVGRRWLGFGVGKSWGVSCLLVIPLAIWMDLRFSVLVVDENGNPVEVDTKQIQMQASYTSMFSWGYSTFHYGYGNRLKKGIVYFGFCQWVRHRERWLIWGDVVSPEGELLRKKKIDINAYWGNWPLRITVDRKSS